MTDTRPVYLQNDDSLLRAVASGTAQDVFDLFKLCNFEITSFSNHALNWSVIQACYMGHASLVQFLLQDNARLEVRDDNGNTPLLICSLKEMSDIVRILLIKGTDVNAANNNGDTALILTNSREVIHILLCHKGIEFNYQNTNGYTALMSAIENMNLIKVKQLILAGACPGSQVNHEDIISPTNAQLINTSGENALQIAHRKGVGDLVGLLHRSYLLDQHPLIFSVVNDNLESCNTLLRHGLFDNFEIMSIKPNILCVVLNFIRNNNICVSNTEVELVTRLCQSGLNVNKCSDCDKSPLTIVMEIGSYDLAEILCKYGVIIPHQTIINLVIKENINLIPLFAVHGAVINQLDENCTFQYPGSALDVALKNSQIGCANVLLYHGAHLDVKNALNQAVDTSNVITLEFLIHECQEETQHVIHNNPELFHKAVRIGDLTVLELLLEAGADIDAVYGNETPLMNAVHLDVISYLLQKGANVNMKFKTTALINVISWAYLKKISDIYKWTWNDAELLQHIKKIIDVLLKFGANLQATDDTGSSVLIKSFDVFCHIDVMKFLLDKGSKINHRNSSGQSALFIASKFGNLERIRMLIEYGANINLQSNDGSTPLHEAVHSLEIVKVLIDHNANVNAQDNMGNTPLLAAVIVEDVWELEEVLELLIKSGADVNHTNKDGMSALMLAIENGNEEGLSILLKCKADVNIVSMTQDKHQSALSILLNKWYISLESQFMAITLLEHGANTKYVRSDTIHKIIASNHGKLVQGLIVSGLCLTEIVLKKKLNHWPIKTISPLSVCLMKNNLQLAKYFIKNWYLTKSDIKILSRNETILENVNFTTCQYLKEVSTEPLRLELLSFICVSTALGSGTDREEKVKKSPLPPILQEYLLYKKVDKEALDASDDIDDNLNFCLNLTKRQLDSLCTNSEYLEKDETFHQLDRYLDYETSSSEESTDQEIHEISVSESSEESEDTDNTDSSRCTIQ